jgi:hypothetical protein
MDRVYYLAGLLRSTGFLALLAPEWLLPALPGLAINLLSTDPLSYSGVYQYNATIIPFIMIAAIYGTRRLLAQWQAWRGEDAEEAKGTTPDAPQIPASQARSRALPLFSSIAAFARRNLAFFGNLKRRLARLTAPAWRTRQWERFGQRIKPLASSISTFRLQWVLFAWITLMFGLNFLIAQPQLNIFWADHEPGVREQRIEQLLAMIPPDASVSASDDLNPHVSERQFLTVFPSICLDARCDQVVQYLVVDLNSLTTQNQAPVASELYSLRGQYRILAQAEGVVLLIHRSA